MSIVARNLIKEVGDPASRIISNINLVINDGEFISISGRSGSGKSTLLYLLSTLDQPTSGELIINEKQITTLSVEEIHHFRNKHLGFVFQFHYLLPELNAIENVLMPARKNNQIEEKTEYAHELFKIFDIENKKNKLPGQLSGGEQQRVAIARALIMKPSYLFADEPTGNLDSKNGNIVMNILKETNLHLKTTVILVTHEPEYSAMADREIILIDGVIKQNQTRKNTIKNISDKTKFKKTITKKKL